MRDFFISYSRHDQLWAEWIAWQLKEASYSVWIQAWHFGAGGNFVLDMDHGATAKRTIAVLSDRYFESSFTKAEWTTAFAADPDGRRRTLVPVLIAPCKVKGLFRSRIFIDLIGLSEREARAALLNGLNPQEPTSAPMFPPSAETSSQPAESPERMNDPPASEPPMPDGFFTPSPSSFPRQKSTPAAWRRNAEFFRALARELENPELKAIVEKKAETTEERLRRETRRVMAIASAGFLAGIVGMMLFTSCGELPLLHIVSLIGAAASLAVLLFIALQNRVSRVYQWIATVGVPCALAGLAYVFLASICTYRIVAHVVDEGGKPFTNGTLAVDLGNDSTRPADIDRAGNATLTGIPGKFRDDQLQARIIADVPNYRLEYPDHLYSLDRSPPSLRVARYYISALPPFNDKPVEPGWPDHVIAEISNLGHHPSEGQLRFLRSEFEKGRPEALRLLEMREDERDNVRDYGKKLKGILRILYHIQQKTPEVEGWSDTLEKVRGTFPDILEEITR